MRKGEKEWKKAAREALELQLAQPIPPIVSSFHLIYYYSFYSLVYASRDAPQRLKLLKLGTLDKDSPLHISPDEASHQARKSGCLAWLGTGISCWVSPPLLQGRLRRRRLRRGFDNVFK